MPASKLPHYMLQGVTSGLQHCLEVGLIGVLAQVPF